MNIMLLFSGVILANKEIDKKPLEKVTPIVEHYKIIPQDVIQRDELLVAKKKKTKKVVKKTSQKKKKVTKKKVYKSKKKKKTTYKQTTRVRYNVGEIQSYAHQLVLEYGWSEQDYQALVLLWYRESSWNPNAYNKSSGACGIPQSKPCSKMAKFGRDYRTNWKVQVRWGLDYIKNRYGTPSEAYRKFLERKPHWY